MSLKDLFKRKRSKEPKQVEQTKPTEEQIEAVREAIKSYTPPTTPNTLLQKVNRHGEYGFALRRANKQNRKAGTKYPSYPPNSFI